MQKPYFHSYKSMSIKLSSTKVKNYEYSGCVREDSEEVKLFITSTRNWWNNNLFIYYMYTTL